MRCSRSVWLAFLLAAGGSAWAKPEARLDSLVAQITRSRAAKDSLLRHAPDSPIPLQSRPSFTGLRYFPVDLSFRVIGELHIYGRRQQISVPTSAGTGLAMEKFGRLQGRLQGKPFWLEVYRSLEDGELLVLFKDPTNGQETYAGGRYAALSSLGEGQYLLDFNMSYNPYCAYNPNYVCPLPPPQNYLSVPIRAGEKAGGLDLAH